MCCSRSKCQPSAFITCVPTAKFAAPRWSCSPRRPLPADGAVLRMLCLNGSLLSVKFSFCSPSPFHRCHPASIFSSPCSLPHVAFLPSPSPLPLPLWLWSSLLHPERLLGLLRTSFNNDQGCSLGTPPPPPPLPLTLSHHAPLISPTGNQAVPRGDQQVDRPVQCVPALLECGCQVPHGPQVRRPAGHRALPLLPGK